MTSLMPKGVEHEYTVHKAPGWHGVMTSLMPKGVEHKTINGLQSLLEDAVMTSLMPKGVEHTFLEDMAQRQQEGSGRWLPHF